MLVSLAFRAFANVARNCFFHPCELVVALYELDSLCNTRVSIFFSIVMLPNDFFLLVCGYLLPDAYNTVKLSCGFQ